LATAGRQGADIFFGIFEGQIDFYGILIIIIITSIFLGALIYWRICVSHEKNNMVSREKIIKNEN
jgi:hypothetical protein